MNQAFSNAQQLGLRFRPSRLESRSLLLALPFGVAPHLVRRRVRRALCGEDLRVFSATSSNLFRVRQYVEDVTILEQIEQRARALARSMRRRQTGRAIAAWTLFACTPVGRRIHAVKDALISRIESEEAALCG